MRIVALIALALATGCGGSEPSEPGRNQDLLGAADRRVGVISGADEGAVVIQAPDTVHAGIAFAVVVNSFGSSGCVQPDGAEFAVEGALATVTPWDLVSDGPCTRDYVARPHPLTLTFTQPGQARITARGMAAGGGWTTASRDVVVLGR